MINRKMMLVIAAGAALLPVTASAEGGTVYSSRGYGSHGWGSTGWGGPHGGATGSGSGPSTSSGGTTGSGGLPSSSGTSGNPVSVPEPASMALLGSGLAMLAGRRLRRRK